MKFFKNTYILMAAFLVMTVLSAASPQRKFIADPPDMDKIKAEVTNPNGKNFYPKLMARYERNETIMTLQDYRLLYLGYVFQEDYEPYRRTPLENITEELYYRTNHTRQECDSIIVFAERALADDPFDLQQINFLIYALRHNKKNNLADIWQYRLNHLVEAILSTGSGTDPETAWVVIDPKHEYNIINFHNSIAESAEYLEPYYDYIKLAPSDTNDKQPEGYYFNIRYILEEYYRKHPEQRNDQD